MTTFTTGCSPRFRLFAVTRGHGWGRRVDAVVPPGTDVDPGDLYIDPTPALIDKRLRRR